MDEITLINSGHHETAQLDEPVISHITSSNFNSYEFIITNPNCDLLIESYNELLEATKYMIQNNIPCLEVLFDMSEEFTVIFTNVMQQLSLSNYSYAKSDNIYFIIKN